MTSRRRCASIAVVLLLYARAASGDPDAGVSNAADASADAPVDAAPRTDFVHFGSPLHVVTDGGSDLHLPKGYFLDETAWNKREIEFRRLQDIETRYGAENKSLRASAEGWQPGWRTVVVTLLTGIAGGWYLHSKL